MIGRGPAELRAPADGRWRGPAGIGAVALFATGLALSTAGVGADSPSGAPEKPANSTAPPLVSALPATSRPTTATAITVQPEAAGSAATTEGAARVAYVSIPALGTTAVVIDLGIGPDGELEVPGDVSQAGWFTGGALPGRVGPAVIVGHRDSFAGPAVFARLGLLRPDDVVDVTLDDGTTLRHRVVRVDRVAKDRFPTEQVYGNTSRPELRLITCDGVFNRGAGSYEGNLVVHAVLV